MDAKKVLIIEDDANIVGLLSIHLNDLGCQVVSEADGQKGLLTAKEKYKCNDCTAEVQKLAGEKGDRLIEKLLY